MGNPALKHVKMVSVKQSAKSVLMAIAGLLMMPTHHLNLMDSHLESQDHFLP
jgi:hypothetical protein